MHPASTSSVSNEHRCEITDIHSDNGWMSSDDREKLTRDEKPEQSQDVGEHTLTSVEKRGILNNDPDNS